MKKIIASALIQMLLLRNIRFWKCFLILLFFPAITVSAEASFNSIMNFRQFGPDDGLPTSQIPQIIQDHIGFISLATHDGLIRFDSHKFNAYRHDPKDIQSLAGNLIQILEEDLEGSFWFVTIKKYARF